MFRHRKRLISKRLNRLMHLKTKKAMQAIFHNFIHSRSQQLQQITPTQLQPQMPQEPIKQESQSIEEQEEIEEIDIQQQQDDEEDVDPAGGFSIADYVASLSPHEKKIFKQQNPQLPETFFMTKKEKEKYFALKAQKYQNSLKSTPDRKAKTGKHVQFRDKFVFKPFNEFEKVTEVKKAKESQSPYSAKIHFS